MSAHKTAQVHGLPSVAGIELHAIDYERVDGKPLVDIDVSGISGNIDNRSEEQQIKEN